MTTAPWPHSVPGLVLAAQGTSAGQALQRTPGSAERPYGPAPFSALQRIGSRSRRTGTVLAVRELGTEKAVLVSPVTVRTSQVEGSKIVHNLPSPAPLFPMHTLCQLRRHRQPSKLLVISLVSAIDSYFHALSPIATNPVLACLPCLCLSSPSQRLVGFPPDRLSLASGHRRLRPLSQTPSVLSPNTSRGHRALTIHDRPDRSTRRCHIRSRSPSPSQHPQGLTTKLALTASAVAGDALLSPYRSSIHRKGRHSRIASWAPLGCDIVERSAGRPVE